MKITKHILFIVLSLFLYNEAATENSLSHLEMKARKSEGIYQLLRRSGLKANRAGYDAFRNINVARMQRGDDLFSDVTYKLPIVVVSFDESFESILQKFGVLKYRESVFTFNTLHNPGFNITDIDAVPKGLILHIPELTSGYYDLEDPQAVSSLENDSARSGEKKSIPYPKLKSTFKKGSVSTKLANYCFVLDPGHGGNDPGTNPFVKRGDGKEAHAFEAPLVYDTTLRLMKFIILNGGDVFLTHFSPDFGIRDIKNPQYYRKQQYNMSNKNIMTDRPVDSIKERKRITGHIIARKYNKGKKVIFLSIHADYLRNKKTDLPIRFFYHKNIALDKGKSKKFAQNMARYVTGSVKNSKAQYLGVLFNNSAYLELLVELANLNNTNGAWRMRYHSYREKLAGKICDGLIRALP